MKNKSIIFLLVLVSSLFNGKIPAQANPLGHMVSIKSWISKTAFWVGDILEYQVIITHDKGLEIMLDNLKREDLNLEPFHIIDIKTTTRNLTQSKSVSELILWLTCYKIDQDELTIPSFSIYYFIHGPERKDSTEIPAKSLNLPPVKVGFRHTLPTDPRDIRDRAEIESINSEQWLIPSIIGILLFLGLSGQYARWIFIQARLKKPEGGDISQLSEEDIVTKAFNRIKEVDLCPKAGVIEFYTRVYDLLIHVVNHSLEAESSSLTPAEIEAELLRRGKDERWIETVRDLLDECQVVKYSKNGDIKGRKLTDSILEKAREIISKG